MKRTTFIVLLLTVIVLLPLLGWGAYLAAREIERREFESLLEETPKKIVEGMSLEEKVGQIIHIGMSGKKIGPTVIKEIQKYRVGGVILFAANFGTAANLKKLNTDLQKLAIESNGIPLLISTDQEGGRVLRIGPDGTTQFPGAMALGQTGEPQYAEDVGVVTGYELRKLGVNIVLAPVLDVNNNPANPVINVRSFGSNPEVVTEMGTALARGLRRSLSVPVIKHFPGHGDTDTDSHLALPTITRDLPALEATELIPFRAAIQEDAEVVMTAHILFGSLDKDNPATLSKAIIGGLLRDKLGFQGLVMTDAMEMHAISKRYTNRVSVKKAFAAGVDIILLTSDGEIVTEMYSSLLRAFQDGELSVEQLDAAVERQIRLKFRRGLFHRLKSPRLAAHERAQEIAGYFEARETRARAIYESVLQKYADQKTSLNESVSRAGIASLRKEFAGVSAAERENVYALMYSKTAYTRAIELGLPKERVIRMRKPSDMYTMLKKRRAGQTWLVEIPGDRHIASYNRLIKILETSPKNAPGKQYSGKTVALHTGNPFLKIRVPKDGAVLAGFSPTTATRRALVYRALVGQPVRQADLILPPE
ncbi:MAG: glycoside hydrolase family 3 protein [bacterium]|nr:glycoside hydrolase family 3 protein [bacterium]